MKKANKNFLILQRKNVRLRMGDLAFFGDGKKKEEVFDPALGKEREGQFFVSLPTDLAKVLPGSVCLPVEFLQRLRSGINFNHHQRLIGDNLGNKNNPALSLATDGFVLRVFHGSFNPHALEISRLAALGFTDPQVRGQYQTHLFEIMEPVINRPSEFNLRIIEDCLASGDTLVGVLALFHKLRRVDLQTKIIIDVAVATTQGILVLRKFAKDNNLSLELNVGYLAYGLSKGKEIKGTSARDHANYIIYPTNIRENLGLPEFVVGDMGDASQRTPGVSWDQLRTDSWGSSGGQETALQQLFDPSKPTALYLTNGGYLMKAFSNYLQPDLPVNEVVFSAKRVWSDDLTYGYGVLISEIPKEILR